MIAVGLTGGLIIGGLVLSVAELTRRAPAPGTPAVRRLTARRLAAAGKRSALAAAAGLAMLAITRWPVVAMVTAAAVIFVPMLTATRATRQRTARLDAKARSRNRRPRCRGQLIEHGRQLAGHRAWPAISDQPPVDLDHRRDSAHGAGHEHFVSVVEL